MTFTHTRSQTNKTVMNLHHQNPKSGKERCSLFQYSSSCRLVASVAVLVVPQHQTLFMLVFSYIHSCITYLYMIRSKQLCLGITCLTVNHQPNLYNRDRLSVCRTNRFSMCVQVIWPCCWLQVGLYADWHSSACSRPCWGTWEC